jgi:hypothetical protein
VTESSANAEADGLIRKYYGKVYIGLAPMLQPTECDAVPSIDAIAKKWGAARQAAQTTQEAAEKASSAEAAQEKRAGTLIAARALALANFKLDAKEFGLPAYATSPSQQETALRLALDEIINGKEGRLAKIKPFAAALAQRIQLALSAADAQASAEAKPLVPLLQAVTAELPRLREIVGKANAFSLLGQNQANHPRPDKVRQVMGEVAADLKRLIDSLQQSLNNFQYPFPHPRAPLTVAEYARSEKPADNEWHRLYMDSHSHAERLFALHYRLTGRILKCADTGEAILERINVSTPD